MSTSQTPSRYSAVVDYRGVLNQLSRGSRFDLRKPTISPAILQVVADLELPAVFEREDIDQAFEHEVAELLLSLAEQASVSIPPEYLARLTALSMRSENRSMVAEKALAKVADIADQTGCDFAVFKGPANAVRLYEETTQRPFNDVDILVGFDGLHGLEDFLISLGRNPESAAALVLLAEQGQPIHEIALSVAGAEIDVHFNPFGLITPMRAQSSIAAEFVETIPFLGRSIRVPSPELSLLISSVNLVRKGGGALWVVADLARLIQGRAGDVDWDVFAALAAAEGLEPIAGQALRLLHDDLGVDVPSHIRAKTRTWWGPELGEGTATKGVLRRGTLSILHRDPLQPIPSLRALRRWYLPTSVHRTARSAEGSSSLSQQVQQAAASIAASYRRRS